MVFRQVRIKKKMEQRLGLGSGSVLARLFLALQLEGPWEPS